MPPRAPHSMLMLQTVMRPSIESERIVLPANSMKWPVPPEAEIRDMTYRTMSLAVTPGPRRPSTVMRIVLGLGCRIHCEAKTISTSDVPMPNATAPKAPCVDVWLSPQTIVIPGCVMPSSGPTICTTP